LKKYRLKELLTGKQNKVRNFEETKILLLFKSSSYVSLALMFWFHYPIFVNHISEQPCLDIYQTRGLQKTPIRLLCRKNTERMVIKEKKNTET